MCLRHTQKVFSSYQRDAEVGSDALAILGLRDTVLELGLTPNRSDALSMLGVAYEVGAILSEEIQYPEIVYQTTSEKHRIT